LQNLKNDKECSHEKVKKEGGFLVCQDCGMTFEEYLDFSDANRSYNSTIQSDYERNIRIRNSKALQDPKAKEYYDRIIKTELWYRTQNSFTEQRKTIEFLKGYDINIDIVKSEAIKKRYLRYNRNHRKSYQNMVIILLAIIWMEIKDTTNIRIERFIEISNELGHKINKKMLTNAMLKVKNTETLWTKVRSTQDMEHEIKTRIKILIGKGLNNIPYQKVKDHISSRNDYDKLKIEIQLIANKLLNEIPYENLKNINFKAFTAGLIYYIGQTLDKESRKIYTQAHIQNATKFSSTTIRKKFHALKVILGDPQEQKNLLLI